jgi:hypothetical protein
MGEQLIFISNDWNIPLPLIISMFALSLSLFFSLSLYAIGDNGLVHL